ncbi:hypothetical protein H2O73_11420 [Vibrio sp. 404]|uniref:Uncharacterized protein n=1 Tax=Vibrio marinisediminis TaxID=2758441 RepID=A0A7W2FRK6_9VIBR|nr:hypothetical protein [Vibrio marinisediminis]MBA5762958.1 hypothetical protein [Vibrio marinisediminis]
MIKTFELDGSIKNALHKYITLHLKDINPYTCELHYAQALSQFMFSALISADDREGVALSKLIRKVQNSTVPSIPTVHIKNIAGEPPGTLMAPREIRGFDYSTNCYDRMKICFFTEWISWALALLFRHTNIIHPSEHGGKNRFHMVSPICDQGSRTLSASTGGGEFLQHSDATVYTAIKTTRELEQYLKRLGTSSSISARVLGLSEKDFRAQVLCGKYSRVDATMLTGIVNKNTKTLITSPEILQKYLIEQGFGQSEFKKLSEMPVAHIAGPADGEISGFVGNIVPPLLLSDQGEILGTCINLASHRMVYVGNNEEDKALFAEFCEHAIACPSLEVVVEASDILLFPNLASKDQRNVTHGREKIANDSYNVEVDGVVLRRSLCRQYLVHCNALDIEEQNYGTC